MDQTRARAYMSTYRQTRMRMRLLEDISQITASVFFDCGKDVGILIDTNVINYQLNPSW